MKKILLSALVPLTALVLMSCSADSDNTSKAHSQAVKAATPDENAAPVVDPNFATSDLDGNQHTLNEWVGHRPVVVNLWGTWCPPCRREIPDLVALYKEFDGQVEIVSIALERKASPQQVKSFAEKAGMSWVHLLPSEDILRFLRYDGGVPTTIFFDGKGREINRHVGARTYSVFKKDFEAIAGT